MGRASRPPGWRARPGPSRPPAARRRGWCCGPLPRRASRLATRSLPISL